MDWILALLLVAGGNVVLIALLIWMTILARHMSGPPMDHDDV